LLFFDRTQPTTDIWFYEHILPEGVKNYTKTRPMQFEEFQPILDWWDNRVENERAWKVRAADLIQSNGGGDVVSVNLDIKNPSRKEDLEHLPPAELAESILVKEKKIAATMDEIESLLNQK
jgi:type I restriction enzyme M protein